MLVKDISINTIRALTGEEKKKASDLIERKRKEDSRLVKGVFKNLESPGGNLSFGFKKYRGDPIRVYTLEDGETATIPICVANRINGTCNYKKNKYLVDKDGKSIKDFDKPIQRFLFVSTEFEV